MNCSLAQTLEIVGEWWTLLIIRDALFGVTRFDEFQSRLGIARNVLTQRLEDLVSHGIMDKVAYSDHPPRFDYRLTDKGRDLGHVVNAMRQWGETPTPLPAARPSNCCTRRAATSPPLSPHVRHATPPYTRAMWNSFSARGLNCRHPLHLAWIRGCCKADHAGCP